MGRNRLLILFFKPHRHKSDAKVVLFFELAIPLACFSCFCLSLCYCWGGKRGHFLTRLLTILLPMEFLSVVVLAVPLSVISALFMVVAVSDVQLALSVTLLLLRDAMVMDSDSALMFDVLFSPDTTDMSLIALICALVLVVPSVVNMALSQLMCLNCMSPISLLSARRLLHIMESSFMLPEPRLPIWKTSVWIVPFDSNDPLLQIDTILSSGDDMFRCMSCFVFTLVNSTWLSPLRLIVSVPESKVVLSRLINAESPMASSL